MANIWNHCRFYAGKLSLLLMMILDMVDDLQRGNEQQRRLRALLNENNGFGPISQPRDKGKKHIIFAEVCGIVICIIILMVYRMFTSSVLFFSSDSYMLSSILFSIIMAEFIRRCCLLAEEIKHVEERYMGSYAEAIVACIHTQGWLEIVIVFTLCAGFTIYGWRNGETSLFPVAIYIIASFCGMVFIDILNIKRLSDVEISDMNEAETKNVSAGLAWSFYFGYLRLILPEFLNTFQKARGEGYRIDNEDVCDKILEKNKRLFIIIPKDGYCYKNFSEFDDRIVLAKQMPEQLKTRGGVHHRSYKNSLYRIEKEGHNPKYIVLEYATPVLSMYDMSLHNQANFSDEERRRQVVEFYKTLKMILSQDRECSGRAKLILIGEGATGDFDGQKLADIIWNHID